MDFQPHRTPPHGYKLLSEGDTITKDTIYWSIGRGQWMPVQHYIGELWHRQANATMAAPTPRRENAPHPPTHNAGSGSPTASPITVPPIVVLCPECGEMKSSTSVHMDMDWRKADRKRLDDPIPQSLMCHDCFLRIRDEFSPLAPRWDANGKKHTHVNATPTGEQANADTSTIS